MVPRTTATAQRQFLPRGRPHNNRSSQHWRPRPPAEVPSMADPIEQRAALLPIFRGAMDFAAAQSERVLREHPGYAPMYTVGGTWGREGETWTHWCEGFFPGILWLLHFHTGEARRADAARTLSRRLEPRQHDRTVHDLGFLFFSTYLRELNLTGDPYCRDVLIQAGRTL